ncbi:TRAP transporter substrate-binding protein [Paracoccus sp. (in: a-proteobacteria)]|uniref:TRAP transporter substrate-binding protein n=1 Tax=Paracoccus sp. TaxID=267 RepID=UPI003A859025
MKKLLLAVSVSAMAFASAAQAMDDVIVAFAGTEDMERDAEYVFIKAFADSLAGHDVTTVIHPANSMGKESERFDQTSQGLISVNIANGGTLFKTSDFSRVLFLPFFFRDEAQFDSALDQSGAFDRMNEEAENLGVRIAGFAMRGGSLGLFNNEKPVTTMADVAGMRLRAQNGDQVKYMEAWGARPTVVSWAETPNALQTGVAVGHFNPPSTVVAAGQVELLKYFTPMDAGVVPKVVMLSSDWYDYLSDEEKGWVDEAVAAGVAANRAWTQKMAPEFEKIIQDGGIEITPLKDGEREKFVEATKVSWPDMADQADIDLLAPFVN